MGNEGWVQRSKRRAPRHPWHDDHLGRVARSGMRELREATPSEAVWSHIAEGVGLTPLGARARLARFVSGRLGRSTESLMRAVAVGAVAVALTTLSATSFGVLLSGGGGPQVLESQSMHDATGLSPSEARIQQTMMRHSWDRRLPPGATGSVWWRRLLGKDESRPFDPPCDIFHLRPISLPAGVPVPPAGASCAEPGGERPKPLPSLPQYVPVPNEVRL